HGTDTRIEFSLQFVQVIELDESYSRHKRNERSSIFRLTGGGERTESAAMKRVFHGENARLRFAAVLIAHVRERAGQFERAFPGLGAAVAKESAIESRDFSQHLREFCLILVEEKIRNMN